MTEKPDHIDQMKQWAHSAPPPDGVVPTTDVLASISNTRVVAILLTDKGQAYHISNIDLGGVTLGRLQQPRTAITELMDSYNVQDGPDWSAVQD